MPRQGHAKLAGGASHRVFVWKEPVPRQGHRKPPPCHRLTSRVITYLCTLDLASHDSLACSVKLEEGKAVLTDHAWSRVGASLLISGCQLEVVRLVFEGATEVSIAGELGISQHTVHTHINRIHHKLEVGDRVELVMRIFREFIKLVLDPESDVPSICERRGNGGCPYCG